MYRPVDDDDNHYVRIDYNDDKSNAVNDENNATEVSIYWLNAFVLIHFINVAINLECMHYWVWMHSNSN